MLKIKMTKSEIGLALKMIGVAAVMILLMLFSVSAANFRVRYNWLRDEANMMRAMAFELALRGHGLTLAERLAIWQSHSDKLHDQPPKGARW